MFFPFYFSISAGICKSAGGQNPYGGQCPLPLAAGRLSRLPLAAAQYHTTCPAINQSRSSLRCTLKPAPREAHMAANQMKRVQRGRSAASTFDSLAQVWGRPQCGFHFSAPAYSRRKEQQSQHAHVKAHFAAQGNPRTLIPNYAFRIPNCLRRSPRPFGTPSESPVKNAQSQSEPTKPDNRTNT